MFEYSFISIYKRKFTNKIYINTFLKTRKLYNSTVSFCILNIGVYICAFTLLNVNMCQH